jgi:hypothetical protein
MFEKYNPHTIKGDIEMEITLVAQKDAALQVATIQNTQPIQPPVQQKPQAAQKEEVILSQAAKDQAAKLSGNTVQEDAKESPAAAMQEEGITNVIK